MGLIIVTIVGAILGWLVAIVVDRDERAATISCALAGAAGATVGALLAGDVPLFTGVSGVQLLAAGIGAIVAVLALSASRLLLMRNAGSQSLPTRRERGTPAPIRR